MNYKSLLYMCEYPPSKMAGAPIIARRLFENYDMRNLHIACYKDMYMDAFNLLRDSTLDCNHVLISKNQYPDLRPRSFFIPIWYAINSFNIAKILSECRQVIKKKKIEAIFTIPWRCEFAITAYLLAQEFGLELYVYETDDWEAMNPNFLSGYLVKRYHKRILHRATKLWLISPHMVKEYEEKYNISGSFLSNFVNIDKYSSAKKLNMEEEGDKEIKIVYTGSINTMFSSTLKFVCDEINRGMNISGRLVKLILYTQSCPKKLVGPFVCWAGYVDLEKIPSILAEADMLLICISFSTKPDIVNLVKTSLFTKTIDYLASGSPMLVVAPLYSVVADYVKDSATIVPCLDLQLLTESIKRIHNNVGYKSRLRENASKLIYKNHDEKHMLNQFLQFFLKSKMA